MTINVNNAVSEMIRQEGRQLEIYGSQFMSSRLMPFRNIDDREIIKHLRVILRLSECVQLQMCTAWNDFFLQSNAKTFANNSSYETSSCRLHFFWNVNSLSLASSS